MPDKKSARPRQRASPKRTAPLPGKRKKAQPDTPKKTPAPITADTPLTDQETLFITAYAGHWNGAKAAREAGYSEKNAKAQAATLLTRPNLKAALEREKAERLQRLGVRADAVLAELARVGFGNMGHFLTVDEAGIPHLRPGSEITAEQWAAVQSISASETETERDNGKGGTSRTVTRTLSVRLHDKRAALVDLGKHLGIFKEAEDASRPVLIDFGGLRPMSPEEIEAARRAQADPETVPELPPEES